MPMWRTAHVKNAGLGNDVNTIQCTKVHNVGYRCDVKIAERKRKRAAYRTSHCERHLGALVIGSGSPVGYQLCCIVHSLLMETVQPV